MESVLSAFAVFSFVRGVLGAKTLPFEVYIQPHFGESMIVDNRGEPFLSFLPWQVGRPRGRLRHIVNLVLAKVFDHLDTPCN